MSNASRVQVRYVEESTWGTTPASALKNFRATGFNLKRNQATVVSEEIRSDSQITDIARVGQQVEGEVPFEASYGTIDDLIEGACRSDWAVDTGLSGTESGTDLLQNGTTSKSYTLEAEYADITQFQSFTGCRVNSFNLSIRPGQVITGSFGFMGKANALAGTTVGTGSATAATTTKIFNAVDHVSAVSEGGSSIEIVGLDLSIANNLRPQAIVGQLALDGIGYGDFNLTGTLEAYFENATLLNKFLNFTASSLRVTLTDTAGNAYVIDIPNIQYSDGDNPVSGKNTDVIVRMPFQALYDSTSGKTIQITRNPA